MWNIIGLYFNSFWQLTVEMAPWLLLGFFIAGLLKVFYPQRLIIKHMGDNSLKSIVNASLIGVPMPLCSCGVIPTGISFYKSGASKSATNSFLISTPQTGVDSIMATYSMLGLPLAIIKPLSAFLIGVFGGKVTALFDKKTHDESCPIASKYTEKLQNKKQFLSSVLEVFNYGFIELMGSIAKWLFIGLAVAALISVLVPMNFFQDYVSNFWIQLIIVLAISIPLYVCATGSIPIAKMLILKGMSPAIALLFLIAGPATNIVTITVLGKTLGKKSLFAYLFSIIFGSLFFTVLIHYFVPINFLLKDITGSSCCSTTFQQNYIGVVFGIVLLAFMLYAIINNFYKNKFTKNMNADNIQIKVGGMSCNHCVNNIEKEISQLNGVVSVKADLKEGVVRVEGNIDRSLIIQKIESLGYNVENN